MTATGIRTGWPPGLLQDDHRGLSQWLATRPGARRLAREAAEQARQERMEVKEKQV